MRIPTVFLTVLFLTHVSGGIVKAGVVFDNTAAQTTGSDPVASPAFGYFGPLYASFSSGSGGILTSLKLLLSGNPGAGGSVEVGLYSDASTLPGSRITDFGTIYDSTLTIAPALHEVVTGAPGLSLAAGTRYWVGLTDNETDSVITGDFWAYSVDTAFPGVENEYFYNADGLFADNPNGPYQMSVQLSAPDTSGINAVASVPEPATSLLALSALLCVSGLGNRARGRLSDSL